MFGLCANTVVFHRNCTPLLINCNKCISLSLWQLIELCVCYYIAVLHTLQYCSPWCGTASSGDTLTCGHPCHHCGFRCARGRGSPWDAVHRRSETGVETTAETASQKNWLCATVRR